jgi:hypothetical protein
MFCPTCGLEHQEARRFCKRCGTNLESVSRTLTGTAVDPMAAQRLEARQKAMSRAFVTFCIGPGYIITLLIVAEILRSVGAYDVARIVEANALFGLLFMFIGLVLGIKVWIMYGRKNQLLFQAQQQPPQMLVEPPPRVAPQPTTLTSISPPQTPPSVTENTTFRLGSQVDIAGFETSPTEEKNPAYPKQPFNAKQ